MENRRTNGPGKSVALKTAVMVCAISLGMLIGCPIYELTGFPCPCCGVTRAWLAFFRGDLCLAIKYHGLFPIIPVFLIGFVIRDMSPMWWCRMLDVALFVFAGMLGFYGVLRYMGFFMMPG